MRCKIGAGTYRGATLHLPCASYLSLAKQYFLCAVKLALGPPVELRRTYPDSYLSLAKQYFICAVNLALGPAVELRCTYPAAQP